MSLYEQLMNAAFRFLSYRNRSQQEVYEYLLKKVKIRSKKGQSSEEEKEVDRVIERLKELDYIDDVAFVKWWVDQRMNKKPKGVRVIRMELLRKGVAQEIIDEYVGDISSDTQLLSAKKAVEKKLNSWKTLPNIEYKQKVFRYLFQRGFSSEIIYRLIDETTKKH